MFTFYIYIYIYTHTHTLTLARTHSLSLSLTTSPARPRWLEASWINRCKARHAAMRRACKLRSGRGHGRNGSDRRDDGNQEKGCDI